MRLLTVVGNRPQFIKAAPLSGRRSKAPAIFTCLVHTGSAPGMSCQQVFFDELGLRGPPDHEITTGSGSHSHQTPRA